MTRELCDCGHDSGQHLMTLTPHMPLYCLVQDCGCGDFRPVGRATPSPEKGEARAAADTMDARMRAVAGEPESITFNLASANISRRTGEVDSNNALALGGVYGDLFDVGDVILMSEPIIHAFLLDIASERRDPVSAMASLYLQAAGVGVLMERKRWEAERAS